MKTHIKIPKSFKLFTHKIKVVKKNKIMYERRDWGVAKLDRNKIMITDLNSDKTKIPQSIQLHTFYHEKVHHILNSMNERDLCNNEKFVDVFAGLLLQSDLTAKYK